MQQEGWHYELEDKNDPLTYKGVVFNEMKGVYSSPDSLHGRTCQQVTKKKEEADLPFSSVAILFCVVGVVLFFDASRGTEGRCGKSFPFVHRGTGTGRERGNEIGIMRDGNSNLIGWAGTVGK